MERHTTYFIVDYDQNRITNEIEYQIIAAVVFEHTVHLDLEKHSIIHLMAVKPGFENKPHFPRLLFTIANTTRLKARKLVVVRRFGLLDYKIENFFNKLRNDSEVQHPDQLFRALQFSTKIPTSSLKKSIAHLCHPESQVLYGDGFKLKRAFAQHSQHKKTAKVLYIHGNVKFMARYNSGTKNFDLYDHPFGWREATTETITYISKHFRDICEENPDRKLSLGAGGYKKNSLGNALSTNDKVAELPKVFKQQSQNSQNNCVWLSAVLLIGRNDYDLGKSMIQLLKDDPNKYEWMFLMKIPPRYQEVLKARNSISLFDALQDKRVKYTLKKINLKRLKMSYMQYILKSDTKGQFLCQLHASGGDKFHVIGIDCNSNPKVVLDPYERYALRLSQKTIDHCCGAYLLGAQGFCYCYELTKN